MDTNKSVRSLALIRVHSRLTVNPPDDFFDDAIARTRNCFSVRKLYENMRFCAAPVSKRRPKTNFETKRAAVSPSYR